MFTCFWDHMIFFNLCIKWSRTGRFWVFALPQKEKNILHLIAANYLFPWEKTEKPERKDLCIHVCEQNKWI